MAPKSNVRVFPLIRGVNKNIFRSGEWARITGVYIIKPSETSKERVCYEVEFIDGVTDYWPVEEHQLYEFSPTVK